jgi:hypothetical protein
MQEAATNCKFAQKNRVLRQDCHVVDSEISIETISQRFPCVTIQPKMIVSRKIKLRPFLNWLRFVLYRKSYVKQIVWGFVRRFVRKLVRVDTETQPDPTTSPRMQQLTGICSTEKLGPLGSDLSTLTKMQNQLAFFQTCKNRRCRMRFSEKQRMAIFFKGQNWNVMKPNESDDRDAWCDRIAVKCSTIHIAFGDDSVSDESRNCEIAAHWAVYRKNIFAKITCYCGEPNSLAQ